MKVLMVNHFPLEGVWQRHIYKKYRGASDKTGA